MSGFTPPTVKWFASDACVVREGERRTVVLGGRRAGSWEPGELAMRNALMVQLAQDPTVVLEDLAAAFEVTSETLRLQRRLFEQSGLSAVMQRADRHHEGGRPIVPALLRRMERLFAQGKTAVEVAELVEGQAKLVTVRKYLRLWKQKQAKLPKPPQQADLPLEAAPSPSGSTHPGPGEAGLLGQAKDEPETEALPPIRAPRSETSERTVRAPGTEPTPVERDGARVALEEFAPFSAKGVQHVGAWLLLVTLAGLGVYAHLRKHEKQRRKGRPLRVAIDALLATLAVGGRCVEGVRRLATSSAAALLLTQSAPSATWVRRTLGGYCAGKVSEEVLADVSGDLLQQARERRRRGEPVVLFFDNHGRQYTGRHLLRRIWRMQDKRTVPGAMDYWVHDAQGRPVLVIPVAPHVSLAEAIRLKVAFLREKLGAETKLLLVFDRAGAFPGLWKWLRDNDVQFVTYQRASYRKFSRQWFERHGRRVVLREADGKKVAVLMQSGRKNLGKGRGRVRRIRILMPDGAQLNVVASSSRSDLWLCQMLFARWRQENGLKHGVQRWGLNQLDGRQVEDVPAGTQVTNPQRANLTRLLHDDRQREKELRLQLQQMYPGHPDRKELKHALKANRAAQREICEARRKMPTKVPIEETGLHGELKQHTREYKLLVDTVRCAAQNAEGELAVRLARHLPRPAEAKRLLQNLFAAPGDIRVSARAITVALAPAANVPETAALEAFLADFNRSRLRHPGDPFARPILFELQIR